jgi:ABC-type Fe3+ transport system permease subunit
VGFIESMADFGNPVVVGGQFSVLSTEIFFAIVGAQYDQGRAASLAWLLTLFALGVFALQRWVLGRQQLHHRQRQGRRGRADGAARRRAPHRLLHRAAVDRLHAGGLPVRLRRRLRADLGPRLHA